MFDEIPRRVRSRAKGLLIEAMYNCRIAKPETIDDTKYQLDEMKPNTEKQTSETNK